MNPLNFIIAHPVVILYLFAAWFVAAVISAMPPLPEGSGFVRTWAYNVAQIVGASLDKVGHAAAQTTYFKQAEQTLKNADGSALQTLATSKVTTTDPTTPPAK